MYSNKVTMVSGILFKKSKYKENIVIGIYTHMYKHEYICLYEEFLYITPTITQENFKCNLSTIHPHQIFIAMENVSHPNNKNNILKFLIYFSDNKIYKIIKINLRSHCNLVSAFPLFSQFPCLQTSVRSG